ncbi:hypothetical protein [Colwellia sp. E2M01]|uniref:Ig-like domain-containing protein n=1 Tax=Colwellia sp. E2M01 TaxID=2841561 RepID=UPI001C08B137|nr:hypothetical protein [Colwellia sp. E2M01]MBU2872045.1 hypothetical protein [Colwellia sp. E2M01]
MKTFKSSKMLLASSIALALSGCGSESYTPEVKPNDNAPTHGGDINITINENIETPELTRLVDLLGTPQGATSGEGVATDADANYLSVSDVVIESTGDAPDDVAASGVSLTGNKLTIRPEVFAPSLDSGETHTVVATYNVFDGKNKTPRTATITLNGLDFAPVATGDLVGNFTKDAGIVTLDLLANVSDADGEVLTVLASDITPDNGNPFALPLSVVDNMLNVDIASIASQVPDGEQVTFNYTYTIKDNNHEIERNMTINILGVKDVAGAPLFAEYFLADSVDETATVQVYDLAVDAVDREGDDVVVNTIKLNGSETIPYGISVEENNLTFDPHAFFADVKAGETKDYTFTYKVADTNGNTSDGERTLTLTLNGVETNLMTANGFPNADFEKDASVGPITDSNTSGFVTIGWINANCDVRTIQAESARTGNYGLRFEGAACDLDVVAENFIPSLADDEKYLASYWFRSDTDTESKNIYSSVFTGTARWAGSRSLDTRTGVWREVTHSLSTKEGGNWDGQEESPINFALMQWETEVGQHDVDDITLISYGDYDKAAHDIIVDNAGLFEGDVPVNSGGGTVAINDAMELTVNTTGSTGVTVSLPLKAGAIKAGNRYVVDLNTEYTNFGDNYTVDAATPITISIRNVAMTQSFSTTVNTWGAFMMNPDGVLSTGSNPADVDWENEDLILDISFTEANAMYNIDNVRVYAIPE